MNNGYESVSPPWSSEYRLEDFYDECETVPQFNAESERIYNLKQNMFQRIKTFKQNVQSSDSSAAEKNEMIKKVYDLLAFLKDHIQPEKQEAIVNAINSMLITEDMKPAIPCIDLCSSDDEDVKPNDSYYSMLQSISINTPSTSRVLLPNPFRRKKSSKSTNRHHNLGRCHTDNVREQTETNTPVTNNNVTPETSRQNEIDLNRIVCREKEKTFFDFIDKLLTNDSSLYKDKLTVNDTIRPELPIEDIDLNKNSNEEKEKTFFDFIDNLIVNEVDNSATTERPVEDGNSVNENASDNNMVDCDKFEMPKNDELDLNNDECTNSIEKGATTPVYVAPVQDFESFCTNRSVNISPQSTSSEEYGECDRVKLKLFKEKESLNEKLSTEMIEEIIGAKINTNSNDLRLEGNISKNTYVQNENVANNLNHSSDTGLEDVLDENNMANLEHIFLKNNNKTIKNIDVQNKCKNIKVPSVQIIRNVEIARGSHMENLEIQNIEKDSDNTLVQENDMENNVVIQSNEKDIENTLVQQSEEENIVIHKTKKDFDNTSVQQTKDENIDNSITHNYECTLVQNNEENIENNVVPNNEKIMFDTKIQQDDEKLIENNVAENNENTLIQNEEDNNIVENTEDNIVENTENNIVESPLVHNVENTLDQNEENNLAQNNRENFDQNIKQSNEDNIENSFDETTENISIQNNEKIILNNLDQQYENISVQENEDMVKNNENIVVQNYEEKSLIPNEDKNIENNVVQNEEKITKNILLDNNELINNTVVQNNKKDVSNTMVQNTKNSLLQNNEKKIENQLVKQNEENMNIFISNEDKITKNNSVRNNKRIIKYTNIRNTETDIRMTNVQKEEDCDVLKALNDEIKGFESSLLNEKNILFNMQYNNAETEKLKLKTAMKKNSVPFTGNKLKKHVTFAKFKKVKYLDDSLGQESNSKSFNNGIVNNSKCDIVDISEENKSGSTMRKKLYACKSRCNYMNYKRKSCSSKTKNKISFQRPEEKRQNEKYRSNNDKIVICNDSKFNNVQRCNLAFFNADNNKTIHNSMKNEEKKISKNSLNFSVEKLILNDKKEQKVVVDQQISINKIDVSETNQQNKTIKTAASRKCYDFNTPQHLKTSFDNTHLMKTLDQLPCFDNKYKRNEVVNETLLKNSLKDTVVRNENKPDLLKKTANTYNCVKIDAQTRYLETPPHSETDVDMKVDEPCNLGFETPPYDETKTDTVKNQTDKCLQKSNDAPVQKNTQVSCVDSLKRNESKIDDDLHTKTENNKTIVVEENERPKRKKNVVNIEPNDPVTRKNKARTKKSKENCPENDAPKFEKLNMPLKIRRKRHLTDFQSEIRNDNNVDFILENNELNTVVKDKINSNNSGKNLKEKTVKNKKDLNQIIDNLISAKSLKFQKTDDTEMLNNNKLVKPKSTIKRSRTNFTEQKNEIEIPNKRLKSEEIDKITSRRKNKSNIIEIFYDRKCENEGNDKPSENTKDVNKQTTSVEKLKNESFVLPVICLTDVCKDPKFLKHLERTTTAQKVNENILNPDIPDTKNELLNNDKDVFDKIINEKENTLTENANEEATTENIMTETPINNEFENSAISMEEVYMNQGDNNIMLSACNLFDSSLLIDNNEQTNNISEEKNDNYNENNTIDPNLHDPVMTSASCKIGEDNLKMLNLYEENSNQSEIPEQGAEVEIGFEQSYSEDLSVINNFYGTQKVDNFMNFVQSAEKPKDNHFESSYLTGQLIKNVQNNLPNHYIPSPPKNIKDNQSNIRQEQDYIYTDKLKYAEKSELKTRNQSTPTKSKRVTTVPRYKPPKTRYDDVEDLARSRLNIEANYISEPRAHSNMERNGLVKSPSVNQLKTYHKKYGLNQFPEKRSSENKRNTEKQLNDVPKVYRNANTDYNVKDRTYDFHEENYNCPSYSDYNKTRKKDKVIVKYNIPVVQSSGRGGNTRYDRTLDNSKRKKSDDGSYAWRFKVPCDSNEHLFPN